MGQIRSPLTYYRVKRGGLGAATPTSKAPVSDPPIYIVALTDHHLADVDFDSDTDDAVAITAELNLLHRGEFSNLSVVVTSSAALAAAALKAVLNNYGYGSIQMGQNMTDTGNAGAGIDHAAVIAAYGVPGFEDNTDFESGTDTYRRALANAPTNGLVIRTGGTLKTVADVLQSSGDGFSALDGKALIAAKCKACFVVAGYWPSGIAVSDFGATSGNRTASNYVLNNWPANVPLIFVGIELGDTVFMGHDGTMVNLDSGNAAKLAANFTQFTTAKAAWGSLATLAAVRGIAPYFTVEDQGHGVINTSSGVTSWVTEGTNKQYYLRKGISDTGFTNILNPIIGVDPSTWPSNPGTLDLDVQTILGRLTTTAYADMQYLLHNLVTGIKADGDWAHLEALWLLGMGSEADSKLNLKGTTYTLMPNGSYTFKPYRGFKGDGTTAYIETGFNPATASIFTQNSNHFGVYVRTPVDENKNDGGNSQFSLNAKSVGGNFGSNNASASADSVAQTVTNRGHNYIIRSNGTDYKRYTDGTAFADATRASATLTSETLWLLGRNVSGSLTAPTTRELAAAHVGDGLLSTGFRARLRAFLRGIGAVG